MAIKRPDVLAIRLLAKRFAACFGAWLVGISTLAFAEPQTIRARLLADIRSTDPGVNRDGITDAVVMHIVEGLVALKEDTTIAPMLAAGIDVSKDGKTYTFKLRRGITFHNGAPLTAKDVVWTFNRYLNPATKWRCLSEFDGRGLTKINSVAALDAHTVVMKLERAAPLVLAVLSRPDCGGSGIYHSSSLAADGSWKSPIGTGPYKLSEWRRGQYIDLVRFDQYVSRTEETSGFTGAKKAEVERIRFTVVPDSAAAKAAVIGGSLDLLPDINVGELEDLKADKNIVVNIMPTASISGILFQTNDPLLKDVRMRRAIAFAIDTTELVIGTTNDLGVPNNSAVPITSTYYGPVQKSGFKTNIAEARRLAKEAGYRGQVIRMLTNKRYGSMYDTAVITQGLAAYAGIKIELEVLDWATQLDRYSKGKYQMMAFSYSARLDPSLVFDMLAGSKKTHPQKVWDNDEVTALIAESMQETSVAKRQHIFDQLHKRMLEDVPMMVLWNSIQISAAKRKVVGYKNWSMEHARLWNVRLLP